MKKESIKEKRKRYYLHKMVRKHYPVHARKRQVDLPYQVAEDLESSPCSFHIKELIALGYNIQTSIN